MKFFAYAAAAATLACAGAAWAAEPVTAKLDAPVAAKTKIIAGGAVFICADTACVAAAPQGRTLAAASCKELAGKVGRIVSFGDGRKDLDAGKLERCNGALPQTQVANR
jgi:hypothetical protein